MPGFRTFKDLRDDFSWLKKKIENPLFEVKLNIIDMPCFSLAYFKKKKSLTSLAMQQLWPDNFFYIFILLSIQYNFMNGICKATCPRRRRQGIARAPYMLGVLPLKWPFSTSVKPLRQYWPNFTEPKRITWGILLKVWRFPGPTFRDPDSLHLERSTGWPCKVLTLLLRNTARS